MYSAGALDFVVVGSVPSHHAPCWRYLIGQPLLPWVLLFLALPCPPPLQRKFLTFVWEFCGGWCNRRTYILKPFMLQEIINVILDWFRVFLMVGLAHRNTISLMVCFGVFYSLLYLEILVSKAAEMCVCLFFFPQLFAGSHHFR